MSGQAVIVAAGVVGGDPLMTWVTRRVHAAAWSRLQLQQFLLSHPVVVEIGAQIARGTIGKNRHNTGTLR